MHFDLTEVQRAWRDKAADLGRDLHGESAAATVIAGAARAGLIDPAADFVAAAMASEALAGEAPGAGVIFALHSAAALSVAGDDRFTGLFRGEAVAAVGWMSDAALVERGDRLSGRAPWVVPITKRGVAVVGLRPGGDRTAYVIGLEDPGVSIELVDTAALRGVACGHLTLREVAAEPIGSTRPIMARVRVLIAAAGLGMGRRALREALETARKARTAAAGEQTVQGLLADAATELDAARLMTWKAASAPDALSVAEAALAKMMATQAAQRAVERATQVIGVDSFARGHIIERLAQDVRALEFLAGRTEALRAAVADEQLP